MDINSFIINAVSLTLASDLIVQAIKTNITNTNTTLVAFVVAEVMSFLGLYFGFYNYDIIATASLGGLVWIIGTVGFDKVKEVFEKIKLIKG